LLARDGKRTIVIQARMGDARRPLAVGALTLLAPRH
jgi:hypothetical protein